MGFFCPGKTIQPSQFPHRSKRLGQHERRGRKPHHREFSVRHDEIHSAHQRDLQDGRPADSRLPGQGAGGEGDGSRRGRGG